MLFLSFSLLNAGLNNLIEKKTILNKSSDNSLLNDNATDFYYGDENQLFHYVRDIPHIANGIVYGMGIT